MRTCVVAVGNQKKTMVISTVPAIEKTSKFQAALIYPVDTEKEGYGCISELKKIPDLDGATHLITAFRSVDGHEFMDDDGEDNAGSRLRGVLRKEKAMGVAIVVARWYGGQNIGKVRFTIICDQARLLLKEIGHKPGHSIKETVWDKKGDGQRLSTSSSSLPQNKKAKRELFAKLALKRQQQASSTSNSCATKKRKPDCNPETISKEKKMNPKKAKQTIEKKQKVIIDIT